MAGEAKKSAASTPSPPNTPDVPTPTPDLPTLEQLLERLTTAVEAIRTDRRNDAGAFQELAEKAVEAISSLRREPVARSFRVQEAIEEHEDLVKKLKGPDFGAGARGPTVTEVFPGHGPPGTRIVIQGRSLGDTTAVLFGDAQATPESVRAGRIEVVVPEQAASGHLTVVTARKLPAQSPQEFIVAPEIDQAAATAP